jgi:HlyD family secretion protein
MNPDHVEKLRLQPDAKRRPQSSIWIIFIGVALITGIAVWRTWPRASDNVRIMDPSRSPDASAAKATTSTASGPTSSERDPTSPGAAPTAPDTGNRAAGSILTVSGYLINRERIEISPRFMGVVKWIGVRKGDAVTNGQVVVLLDDAEYQARLKEAQARLENAKVAVAKAGLDLRRAQELVAGKVEMEKVLDDARLQLESAQATVREVEGQIDLIRTYLDWTVIRSPINGVVLEKLVDPNELVTPQSFGGTRGPSTALISVADPRDLQVEIDLNETDLSKVFLQQKCRVSPEAYLDRAYEGFVTEIAPEANRQKGTLQIKVQIKNPDKYLTPELSAKVDFLAP